MTTSSIMWLVWAGNLVAQNFAFTMVSRARNSGSLQRHIVAAIFSNGIWIMQLQILFGVLMDCLTGKKGLTVQIAVGIYYTFFTVVGAVIGHHWAMRTEKGSGAVGASKKYAQIPVEEWERVRRILKDAE